MSVLVDEAIKLLNDDPTKVYALTFNTVLNAWQVIELVKVEHHSYRDQQTFRLRAGGTNHNTCTEALSDSLKLKLGGHF